MNELCIDHLFHRLTHRRKVVYRILFATSEKWARIWMEAGQVEIDIDRLGGRARDYRTGGSYAFVR